MRGIHFARILTLLVLTAAAAGKTNRVTIGSLTYLGTNEFGSAFRVTLDASAVTAQQLSFASATMFVKGTSQASGAISTPVTLLYIGGTVNGLVYPLASCAEGCVSLAVQLVSADGKPFAFTLLDGERFETFAITTTLLQPPSGQKFIQAQQSVPIVLRRDASGK
jgi:hypothetical protein